MGSLKSECHRTDRGGSWRGEVGSLEVAGGVTAFLSVLLAGQGRLETNMSGGGGPSGALAGSGVWGRCRRLLWPDAGPGSAWWTPSRHPDKPATFSRRVFSQDGCFLCVLTFVLLSPLCSRGGRPPGSAPFGGSPQ